MTDPLPDRETILAALRRSVIDPEVGINIVDLGLVESLYIAPGRVVLGLIMTTPTCPQGETILDQSRRAIEAVCDDSAAIDVQLLDSPFWTPQRMSDEARQKLGWPG